MTHLDAAGWGVWVDRGGKPVSAGEGVAQGRVRMAAETLAKSIASDAKKGNVRAVAEIPGILAAKRTAELIPLCHPIALTSIRLDIVADEAGGASVVTARAKTIGQTGAEMKALTAISVACLTIYDMLKATDRGMVIEGIALLEKLGGASGS